MKDDDATFEYVPYEPAKGPLVIHFRHRCPFGETKKDTVRRVHPVRQSQPNMYQVKLGTVEL